MLSKRIKPAPRAKAVPGEKVVTEAKLDDKTKKARMLISLLGADFARSSNHPFFKRLSQTAIGTTTEAGDPNADMSGALADLLDALGKTEARTKQAPRRAPQQRAVAPKPTARPKMQRAVPPQAARAPEPEDPIQMQHPAIIASKLQSMPQSEKTKILRSLSGRVARQVTIYAREIEAKR